ncbi:MAG: SO2930 family diheme c-type cytochrome [Erythrobacter sp.]|nr:SO2930 family diheme c-type cytochrome [Erythrobacter sp.]
MNRGIGLLIGAAAALAGAIGARALPTEGVRDAIVLGEALPEGAKGGYPDRLSDYGFFEDAAARAPRSGVVPYWLNIALWSDGADKLRYIYVPVGAEALAQGDGLLDLPVGSAILKTFAFGEGADQRFIETRVLLHRAEGWVALPYLWNEEGTEARLAVVGARMELDRPDGTRINYRVPNKNQCKQCHVKDGAVTPIGPKLRNLAAGDLARLGIEERAERPLPQWEERSHADLDATARGYLDVNCAHCHQPGGMASNSGLDLRFEQDDPHAIGIAKPPVAAGRGAGGLEVSIAPGDPDASILLYRMASTEPGIAMPELGRSTNDAEGIAVVRRWIASMEPAR